MTPDEVLAMEGVGYPLGNDELEGHPTDVSPGECSDDQLP